MTLSTALGISVFAGTHQINGTKVDAQKLAARAMLAEHRRNARREIKLKQRA